MELLDAHGAALTVFDGVLRTVTTSDWPRPTPCTEWTVRDLVTHLVNEQLWVPHLLAGATLDEIGDRFDGDLLGEDPLTAWVPAAADARAAWLAPGATERSVHVSSGLIDAAEYGWQMTVDLAVHGWDLATAIGAPNPITGPLAEAIIAFVQPQVDAWQGFGIVEPPVPVPDDLEAPARLIALLGRDPG